MDTHNTHKKKTAHFSIASLEEVTLYCHKDSTMLSYSSIMVTLLVIVVGTSLAQAGKLCPSVPDHQSSCVCKSDRGIIDLTPLLNKADKANSPR